MITTFTSALLLVEALGWLVWLLRTHGFVIEPLAWRLVRTFGVIATALSCMWLAIELSGVSSVQIASLGLYLGLHIGWVIERIVSWSHRSG